MPTASRATTEFFYGLDGGVRFYFTGTGFTYDKPTGLRIPIGGIIDEITVKQRGPAVVSGPRVYIEQYVLSDLALAIPASGIALPTFAGFFTGNDTLRGSADNDLLKGLGGNDTFVGGNGADTFIGGPGRDIIDYGLETGGTQGVKITLGLNAKIFDTFGKIDVPQEIEVFKGTRFADVMSGDTNANEFHGVGGRDNLAGNAGADRLFGGADDDTLSGGDGNDFIDGGLGKDTILGGNHTDTINGGDGDDTINAGSGVDIVNGGSGNDTVDAGLGDDTVKGDAGDDTLSGSDGNDKMFGGIGNDDIEGGAGIDSIQGEVGNDIMFGGAANDILVGAAGSDILIGGPGADKLYPSVVGAGPNNSDNLRDIVRYTTLLDGGATPATGDTIFGFINGAALSADRIDLSPLDPNPVAGNQKFKLVSAFTAAQDEVRLHVVGADTFVEIDWDADAAIDMVIRVVGVPDLRAIDLIL